MAWTEAQPGVYERPLCGTEVGMAAILGGPPPPAREYILINCVVSFRASHPAEKVAAAVRRAWQALRLLKSPDIATSFGDGKKSYKVLSSEDLQDWLDDTFVVSPPGTSVNEAVRTRQAQPTYLPTCTLVPSSDVNADFSGAIILFISHWRTEAAGALKILDQILDFTDDLLNDIAIEQALAAHVVGDETSLLTPTLDDILMPSSDPSEQAKRRVADDFANFYSKFPPLDYPMQGEMTATPTFLKVEQRTYGPDSTLELIRACKKSTISITAAIHAAYLGAAWELAEGEKKQRNYASIMPAQVRTRLPLSSPYRDQGCWDSARMLLITAPPGQSFSERVRHLKHQYSRAATDEWLKDDIKQIPLQMAQPRPDAPPVPASFPWFTSIGLLDGEIIKQEHGSIRVDDITFWADSILPGIVLRLWTFAGQLSIQIQWNAAFHTDAIIKQTLDIIERIIKAELNVDLVTSKRTVEEYNG